MPYNIDPPCQEENKSTVIRWQFPGQPEEENSSGDDYQVSLSLATCNERIDVSINFNCDVVDGNGEPGYAYETWQEPNYGGLFIQNLIEIYDINNLLTPVENIEGKTIGFFNTHHEYIGRFGANSYERTSNAYTARTGDKFVISSLRNVHVEPINPYYYDLCKKYIVKIYNDGEVVFTSEGNEEPTVSWECLTEDECPEGTCEVECGDTICCYGSDGISVFNFPKP